MSWERDLIEKEREETVIIPKSEYTRLKGLEPKKKIILFTGHAKNGKDLAFSLLMSNYPAAKFGRYAFADQLKKDLEDLFYKKMGLNIWNLSGEIKEIVRPMLVAYGCIQRQLGDGLYWVRELEKKILNLEKVTAGIPVITDCRFPNEYQYFAERYDTKLIKIVRTVGGKPLPPPNEEEACNQPLVDKFVDYTLTWETVENSDDLIPHIEALYNFIQS